LKKLFLILCLLVLAVPCATLARGGNNYNNNNQNNQNHKKGNAAELPGIALGAAAVIGVAGYLVLRRRHANQN
jgi:hypothetical protein